MSRLSFVRLKPGRVCLGLAIIMWSWSGENVRPRPSPARARPILGNTNSNLPRRVELDENPLGSVEDDFVEVGGDEYLNRLGRPVLGQILAQQMLLQFAVEEALHEFLHR